MLKSVLTLLLLLLHLSSSRRVLASDDDPLKSFPLLEKGIVVGAGVGAHAIGLNSPRLTGVASTGFAYVGVLPLVVASNLAPETRKYCASYHDSQDGADNVAARRAFPDDPHPEERIETDGAAILQKTGWQVGIRGSCWPWKFGLFIAHASNFDADVRPSADTPSISKTVRPLGSAGILFAPLPYLHLLIGVTYSNVALGQKDAEADQRAVSLFFGLGTTIDAVGGVFK